MGRRHAKGRKVDGILILNKPLGMTSNQSLQAAKHLYQAQKAGHTGTLDKFAQGVLPLCFGEATKVSSFLLDSDKEYLAHCRLGITTTTGDAAGAIETERSVPKISAAEFERILADFRGNIQQIPPMYSALKHKGERLYKLAYAGIRVERKPRIVTIHKLTLKNLEDGRFTIDVGCSKGTYIRTLVEDIGRRVGCGAHVTDLWRTASGPFTTEHIHNFDEIKAVATNGLEALDRLLLPIDVAVRDLSRIDLVDSAAFYLCQGQPVMVLKAPTTGHVRLYSEQGRFLGIGEILDDGRVAPRRMVVT